MYCHHNPLTVDLLSSRIEVNIIELMQFCYIVMLENEAIRII